MIEPLATRTVQAVARVGGLALLSAAVAAGAAALHRWYARERVPDGVAVLAGLGAVGLALNTRYALAQFVGGDTDLLGFTKALVTVVAFFVASLTAAVGARLGDRFTTDVATVTDATALDRDVSRIVSAVGRVITVRLPETIADVDGYDPTPPETKASLAGKTLTFPRGLTVAEFRDRLVARLQDDYGVGHVDVELADDGTVEYLAVGRRVAGLGPTLAPGTAAVAVRADPPFSAGPGDVVGVWREGDDGPERVATAEFRAAAGDVVTLAVDDADAAALDDATSYRLVTLPARERPEREFAAQLRAADETMAVVTLAPDSPLVGLPVGGLDVTVVAVGPPDGGIAALPSRERVLAAGDTVYALARPDLLRRVEQAAGGSRSVDVADRRRSPST
ncbi:hypothetical protein DMJ13_04180 [halophilic archaeon]|nr:hypothetical protein DMJ13_04180 [halophilic archaeon]